MSAHHPHGHGDHANLDHDLHSHGDTHGHGSLKGYMIGFVLSVILTAIPFWAVMTGGLGDTQTTALVIMGLAFVQIVVHMIYFLHMNTKSEGGWTMMALVFTAVLVVITLSGSIWVMYHMNTNMMPDMAAQLGGGM
ncbi:cytochrome o ubiquinol oxidase subunit IV [Sphingomonas sp. NPDC019816]|uniref:cytochrome o ubiquinol oxidase subunit IV n=1 Tax=unclassified Sphingomonas TaxID=196159 RepID=UPI0039186533